MVYKKCLERNYILIKSSYEKIKIEGAHVIDAIPKRYKYPLIVFDYESLYPNCIITYNLSPDTYIEND